MQELWYRAKRRSPVLRKSFSILKQLPRVAARMRLGSKPSYSLFANSFPKSGTHLLVQVLEAFPQVTNYDSFIATLPSVTLRPRSDQALLRRIGRIAPGELVSGHLWYKPAFLERLLENECIVYFIYRDLRDVVVSTAHYLAHMNRWNRAHGYFNRLHDPAERILVAINGIPSNEVPFFFPDIASRFARYAGWLERPEICCIRFEDLVGDRREMTLQRMVRFFVQHSGQTVDQAALLEKIVGNIDPRKSRTYRSGRAGRWREEFSVEHVDAMKEVAGDLLIQLGYEQDLEWSHR